MEADRLKEMRRSCTLLKKNECKGSNAYYRSFFVLYVLLIEVRTRLCGNVVSSNDDLTLPLIERMLIFCTHQILSFEFS